MNNNDYPVWHPFTQHQTETNFPKIVKTEGVYLITEDNKKIIDAISSWWLALHGHSHPYIISKMKEQLDLFQQFIFAGFTHDLALNLSKRLLNLLPKNQSKIFFSDNGSTSVEVGIKMATQYWNNLGENKPKIIAFEGAYHGDTIGAMSVGKDSLFSKPFDKLLFDIEQITLPNADNENEVLSKFEGLLKKGDVGIFIFEPLVLGAGGMLFYSKESLDKIIALCKKYNVITIADEVAMGFGKTGTIFASEQLENKPDIICLSKALTAGVLPMGVTSATQKIYDVFLSDNKMKMFLHGHSFTANAISCSAALAGLDLIEKPEFNENLKRINLKHLEFAEKLKELNNVSDIRVKGIILAFEVKSNSATDYSNPLKARLYKEFLKRGVLIRPLGNVVYLLPPSIITNDELTNIYNAIIDVLKII